VDYEWAPPPDIPTDPPKVQGCYSPTCSKEEFVAINVEISNFKSGQKQDWCPDTDKVFAKLKDTLENRLKKLCSGTTVTRGCNPPEGAVSKDTKYGDCECEYEKVANGWKRSVHIYHVIMAATSEYIANIVGEQPDELGRACDYTYDAKVTLEYRQVDGKCKQKAPTKLHISLADGGQNEGK
jgi:hypothetical protein